MDYRVQSTCNILQPIRFFPRRSHWSGRGVQGYPWVRAYVGNEPLPHTRVQGPPFWSGDQGCYLIDLGRDVHPGEQLTLLTQAMYIDEAGSFSSFIGFRAPHALESLVLTCAFKSPPAEAFYSFRTDDDCEPTGHTRVALGQAFGLEAFRFSVSPCKPGIHSIRWNAQQGVPLPEAASGSLLGNG